MRVVMDIKAHMSRSPSPSEPVVSRSGPDIRSRRDERAGPSQSREENGQGVSETAGRQCSLADLLGLAPAMARLSRHLDGPSLASLRTAARAFSGMPPTPGATLLAEAQQRASLVAVFKRQVRQDFGAQAPAEPPGRTLPDLKAVLANMDARQPATGRPALDLRDSDRTEILSSISLFSIAPEARRAVVEELLRLADEDRQAPLVSHLMEELSVPGAMSDRDRSEVFPSLLRAVRAAPDEDRTGLLTALAGRATTLVGDNPDHRGAVFEALLAEAETARPERGGVLHDAIGKVFRTVPSEAKSGCLSALLERVGGISDELFFDVSATIAARLHDFEPLEQAGAFAALLSAVHNRFPDTADSLLMDFAREAPRLDETARTQAFNRMVGVLGALPPDRRLPPLGALLSELGELDSPQDQEQVFDVLLEAAPPPDDSARRDYLDMLGEVLNTLGPPLQDARQDALRDLQRQAAS